MPRSSIAPCPSGRTPRTPAGASSSRPSRVASTVHIVNRKARIEASQISSVGGHHRFASRTRAQHDRYVDHVVCASRTAELPRSPRTRVVEQPLAEANGWTAPVERKYKPPPGAHLTCRGRWGRWGRLGPRRHATAATIGSREPAERA